MSCNSKDSNLPLRRAVILENPVGRGSTLFGISFKDFFTLRSFEADKLVALQALMAGLEGQ